ncbi:MAG TPA: VanZ family protein [Patescibacteria group bacterium]|nr:VanZ family protein [Patescibacteria group bacterium]
MKKLLSWIPAFCWAGFVYVLSSQSSVKISSSTLIDFLIFKSLHIIEYTVLSFLIFFASRTSLDKKDLKVLVMSFFLSMLYAITDETHQLFVETRSGRLRDIFIDMMGVLLGIGVAWKLLPIVILKPEPSEKKLPRK